MRYHLSFETRALKDLRKLENVHQERVVASIEKLTHNLAGNVKKLKSTDSKYRLRSGNFRMLFTWKVMRLQFTQSLTGVTPTKI